MSSVTFQVVIILAQNVICITDSQESFLGAVSASQPSQESFRGGSEAGGGICSAAFLGRCKWIEVDEMGEGGL